MKVDDFINALINEERPEFYGRREVFSTLDPSGLVTPQTIGKVVKKAEEVFSKFIQAHPHELDKVQAASQQLLALCVIIVGDSTKPVHGKMQELASRASNSAQQLVTKYQVFAEATSLNNLCKVATPPRGQHLVYRKGLGEIVWEKGKQDQASLEGVICALPGIITRYLEAHPDRLPDVQHVVSQFNAHIFYHYNMVTTPAFLTTTPIDTQAWKGMSAADQSAALQEYQALLSPPPIQDISVRFPGLPPLVPPDNQESVEQIATKANAATKQLEQKPLTPEDKKAIRVRIQTFATWARDHQAYSDAVAKLSAWANRTLYS